MTFRAVVGLSFVLATGCGNGATELAADDAATIDGGESADAAPSCSPCSEGVCNPASGACVECLGDGDCAAAKRHCVENTCATCAPADAGCTDVPIDPDPPGDAGVTPEPKAFEIRLASYNVRTSNLDNGAWGDTHVGWDSNDGDRMRRVADTIAAQSLTVVAMQEMRGQERDAVLARLANQYKQDWGFTTEKDGGDDALVLFRKSVWTKVREVHFSIPLQPALGDRNQIGVLLRHQSTGREIWIYSVHFASGDGAAPEAARTEAAKRTVQSITDEAVAKKQPFVLAGDFNSTSDEPPGDVLRKSDLVKYTRNVAAVVVNNGCKSFNGRAGSEGLQVCFGGVASHIDQVWVPKTGIQVLKYQITATQLTSRSSDHNPLTTILKVD